MSTSPRPARVAPVAGTAEPAELAEVCPFPYREVAVPAGRRELPRTEPGLASRKESLLDPPLAQSLDPLRVAEQSRELGRQQGELESRARFEEQLARERAAVAQALTDFTRERAGYYQKIEGEVVQLALSIARKVVHREAQVDPLLLMGIVRVALERIEGATGVVLAVHAERAAEWHRYLASRLDRGDLPEIVEDPALAPDECELRTSMGTAALGLEVQMKEIEQGLMDLLAARPQGKVKL
jgi:flagellar assembly protein FliH